MEVYRILKEPYWTDPLSVIGAERSPGRWNKAGLGILYTSSSPALGLLEIMVHLPEVDYQQLPAMRLFSLQIPDESIFWIDPVRLPANWQEPAQMPVTQHFFESWQLQPDYLALAVPSAVLDVSFNFLIHPLHPLFSDIAVRFQTAIRLERRLWKR